MSPIHSLEKTLLRADEPASFSVLSISFLFLLALLLVWTPWQGNEEHYFQLAHRAVSPDSFSEFHAAFDQSSGRLVADFLIGSVVAALGYDTAHLVLRIMQCLLYAIGFGILFQALRLSIVSAVAAIVIFVLLGEELFAGEWLFRGVEGKTLAYAAVIPGLGLAIRERWRPATLLLVLATWLHFLVGGFWMLALGVWAFLKHRRIALPLKLVGLYSVLVLPLVIAIAVDQFGQSVPSASPSPTEIWAERAALHVAPFLGPVSQWELWDWAEGIAATFLAFVALTLFIPSASNKQLITFVVLLFGYLLVALAITFLDRNTFYFAKFVMFRPSSLALVLALAAVLLELRVEAPQRLNVFRQLALSALIAFFLVKQVGALALNEIRSGVRDFDGLVAAIEEHSDPGGIALAQPPAGGYSDLDLFLPRQLDRPTLVSDKFVPTHPELLIRWNDYLERREALFKGNCNALEGYPIRVLVVYDSKGLDAVQGCGNVVWTNADFSLVAIES